MPDVEDFTLGQGRKVNEVVFAGSHDVAISNLQLADRRAYELAYELISGGGRCVRAGANVTWPVGFLIHV